MCSSGWLWVHWALQQVLLRAPAPHAHAALFCPDNMSKQMGTTVKQQLLLRGKIKWETRVVLYRAEKEGLSAQIPLELRPEGSKGER